MEKRRLVNFELETLGRDYVCGIEPRDESGVTWVSCAPVSGGYLYGIRATGKSRAAQIVRKQYAYYGGLDVSESRWSELELMRPISNYEQEIITEALAALAPDRANRLLEMIGTR